MENNIGINEEKLDKLILDIYNYCEKINVTLNQVSDVVEDTKVFYTGDVADSFRKKFSLYSSNFLNIRANLCSYADDLIKLKSKINLIDYNSASTVKRSANSIDDKVLPMSKISVINLNSVTRDNIGAKGSWR